MPFDATTTVEATEDLSFVPGHEGLRRLAVLLRRDMPKTFRWNFQVIHGVDLRALYGDDLCDALSDSTLLLACKILDPQNKNYCGTVGCAIGLAFETWPDFAKLYNVQAGSKAIARIFKVSVPVVRAIFFGLGNFYGKRLAEITPGDVADAIDAYLREPEATLRRCPDFRDGW